MVKLNKMNLIVFLVLAMLVAVTLPVFSMGKAEVVPYGITLEEGFGDIASQLESGEITLEEAIAALHDLRTSNGREDSPEYQVMEQLLTAVQAQTMTKEQAQLQVCQLDEAAVDCTQEQLKTREREMLKLLDGDGEGDETKTQTQTGKLETTSGAGPSAGSPSYGEGAGSGMNEDAPSGSGSGQANGKK